LSCDIAGSTTTSAGANVETKATTTNINGNNIEIVSKVNENGTIVNDLKITDDNGDELSSKASSLKSDSNVSIDQNGSVSMVSQNTTNSKVKIYAKYDGTVKHVVDITEQNGSIIQTTSISNIAGSHVVIKEDGGAQTSISVASSQASSEEKVLVVEAKADGSSAYAMYIKDADNTTTKVSSQIIGADTLINEDAEIITTVATKVTDSGGAEYQVDSVAKTLADGQSLSWYEYTDSSTQETKKILTVDESTPFEAGNEITIEKSQDLTPTIKVRTKVTKNIIIK
jgi:hypothetical protein